MVASDHGLGHARGICPVGVLSDILAWKLLASTNRFVYCPVSLHLLLSAALSNYYYVFNGHKENSKLLSFRVPSQIHHQVVND